jgi:hypothetical protein
MPFALEAFGTKMPVVPLCKWEVIILQSTVLHMHLLISHQGWRPHSTIVLLTAAYPEIEGRRLS